MSQKKSSGIGVVVKTAHIFGSVAALYTSINVMSTSDVDLTKSSSNSQTLCFLLHFLVLHLRSFAEDKASAAFRQPHFVLFVKERQVQTSISTQITSSE